MSPSPLTSVCLNGRWVKATPVFPRVLCTLYNIVVTGRRAAHPRIVKDTEGSLLTDARTTPARS